jgi:hypothetical protein
MTDTLGESIDSPLVEDDVAAARLRDYRLAEFFSSLAAAVDLLREAVEEMEREDGLTDAAEHAFGAATSAVAALAWAEMRFYEDDGVEPDDFADFYHAIGKRPPAAARDFSQFSAVETGG